MKNKFLLILLLFFQNYIHSQNYWEFLSNVPTGSATSMAIDSENRIFIGGFPNGYFKSNDNGLTWESVPQYARYPLSCAINGRDEIFLGIGAGWGVYRSLDNGLTWSEMNIGLTDRNINCFTFFSDNMIYAGTINGLIFKSINNGESWIESDSGIYSSSISGLITFSSGVVLAGTDSGLFKSNTYDDNWMKVNGQVENKSVTCLTKNSEEKVFLGTTDGSIYSSSDFGDNWELNFICPSQISGISINSLKYIFVICSDTIFYSKDNGINWNALESLFPYNSYQQLKINTDGYIFVKAGPAMFRSIKSTTDVEGKNFSLLSFNLDQNYPNPFNPITQIKYQLPKTGLVTLRVYELLGREVVTLVNEEKPAGSYHVEFNGSSLSSGIYFYKLQAGDYSEVRKMILLK